MLLTLKSAQLITEKDELFYLKQVCGEVRTTKKIKPSAFQIKTYQQHVKSKRTYQEG